MKPIRVLVVDDHRIVRRGLCSILEPDPNFDIVGEATNGQEALDMVVELHPDIVLLDLQMPGTGGLETCQRIKQTYSQAAVVILTAFFDQRLVEACLRAGASGYLLKDAENLHLSEQLLAVVKGQAVLDPRAAHLLTTYLRQHEPTQDVLSPREIQVLGLMVRGLTNKEIGAKLCISENTVKGHVKEVLSKMNARNRVEAVYRAHEWGFL
ncbi:MAG: response regulator transcription factor [Anaerolineales bacterium]|nr:response regulator transcription factor [Anaerolineales bacterium]